MQALCATSMFLRGYDLGYVQTIQTYKKPLKETKVRMLNRYKKARHRVLSAVYTRDLWISRDESNTRNRSR